MADELKSLKQISYQLKIFLRELFVYWNDNASRLIKKRYIDAIDLVNTQIIENFQKQRTHLSNISIKIIRLDEQIYEIEKISMEVDSLSQKINDSIITISKNCEKEKQYLMSSQEKKKFSQAEIYKARKI
jgi:hypothetical protein